MCSLPRRAAAAAGALTLLAFSAAPARAETAPGAAKPDLQVTQRAVPPESGRPVTFDEALGLAAKAPAVAGVEAAAAAQRRSADQVSSLVGNPTLNVQPGTAKDPLDQQWKYYGETTLLQPWNLSGLPGDRKAAVRAEGDELANLARASALSHRLA